MVIDEIAKELAKETPTSLENIQNILNNIELGELERNLTIICFMADMFGENGPSLGIVATTLKNDYGLTSESIEWCYQLVNKFLSYRKQFLKSKNQFSSEYVNLRNISEDNNLPKSVIVRIDKDERKFGITDINCTIKKEESYYDGLGEVRLFGEVKHQASNKTALIYVIVYNDNNEIICYNSETELSKKKGKSIIDVSLAFPLDENISAIYLKPAPDPWTYG
ncbi:hypothetical protein LMB24_00725 [Limosilactobacillus reuteri]|uniref:hypothetical protein n=1 Tax=Limosilactobacillus reuteri TaxID=1598 RepID=UPI001E602234|nr:hypothetical protein [Limosilactobacillus reuteri]MCC4339305.1 hypothetical protein [Limosilactobacillus reuteri]MCC4350900.1 hypothetical protein [Limosilactobacillus reuteri]MCC4360076.1 hypothetical protein [Limosilactobacillus reuteri]MCC4378741.1 hypothetical protein [Limosilactobacillus reuteri]MCC4406732.1 hypothetical protein [Limosilactobacillus reuteri]